MQKLKKLTEEMQNFVEDGASMNGEDKIQKLKSLIVNVHSVEINYIELPPN